MIALRNILRASLALVAVAAIWPALAGASSYQVMTFEAPGELLDSRRDATLNEIKAFGVDRVRVLVYWEQFAPAADSATRPAFDASDPAAYPSGNWDRLDALFEEAAKRDIEVTATLTGPVPKWATKSKKDNVTEPDPEEFKAFATAVGRRYGDRVGIWSIWNEPQHPDFLRPQFKDGRPYSPSLYRGLYFAGHSGLEASGNGNDVILIGETSPRGTPRVVAPLVFFRGMLCLNNKWKKASKCPRVPADGYAHHAYTTRAGPTFRPPDKDDVTIGVLPRLTKALDRAAKAGALPRRLPVYLTEFGIQSKPDPFAGVSLAQQADFLAISERIAFRNPRVKSFSQYLMYDDKPRASRKKTEKYGGFESGLRTSGGKRKPAYSAFPLPLVVEESGRSDKLWGRVRPARGATSVTVEIRSGSSWKTLKTVQTSSSGVYQLSTSHREGRSYRVKWTAPNGDVLTGPPIRSY
jgi:hypothetical protein